MKKFLLILAAALALGSGATLALTQGAKKQSAEKSIQKAPETKTAIMSGSGYWGAQYPFYIGSREGQKTSALYPASVLDNLTGDLDKYTITEIIYPIQNKPSYGIMTVTMLGATTDVTTLTSAYPAEDMKTLAANVSIDFSTFTENEIRIPLTKPMVMEKGQSLVLNLYVTNVSLSSSPMVQNSDMGNGTVNHLWFTYDSAANYYDYTSYAPCFNFNYVEGEVGSGNDEPKPIEVTVATSTYSTTEYPLCVYSSNTTCATETLYPASLFDTNVGLDKYTITELAYPMLNNPGSGVVKVTVMLKTTTETALNSAYSEDDFTVINNYEVDFSKITDKVMRIPLAKPMVMEKGQGLVVGFWTEFTDNRPSDSSKPSFEQVAIGIPGKHTFYNGWNPSDMSGCTLQDTEYVAGLRVKVVEGEVSGGDTPKTTQTSIATSTYTTTEYPLCVYSSNTTCATETLYPASLIGKAISLDTYTITELAYPMTNNPGSGVVKVTLMFTTTTDEALTSGLAADAFEVVASNVEVDFSKMSDKYMRIPLTKPYVMKKGQGLIVGFWTEFTDNRPSDSSKPTFEQVAIGIPGKHTFYNGWNPSDMSGCTLQDTEYVAGVDFVYVEGEYTGEEPKDVVDLEAIALTAPYGTLYTNKAYEFNAKVFNNGTVDVESYKVEIFNTVDNVVLASTEVEKKLAAGLSTTIPFEITFDEPGAYQLAARVVLDTDEVADNNVSEMVPVNVEKLPYKAVSLTGATEAKMNEPETYTITVANEGVNELEDYTVNLYLVREGVDDLLLATSNDNPAIAAGATAAVNLDYTFVLGGDYTLKGAVFTGDNEPSETALLNVTVALDKLTPVIYEQIPKWDGSTFDFYQRGIGRMADYNASQILYTADRFGDHERAYQIQSLTFHIYREEYNNPVTPIKIWLAQTDKTSGYTNGDTDALVPEEDFVLVYDGILVTPQSNDPYEIKVELQNLFMLENGKSLAINIATTAAYTGVPGLDLCAERTEENYQAYTYSAMGGDDFTIYNKYNGRLYAGNFLPVITFGYALEPLPAMMDLAVTDFKQTSENPAQFSTDPVSFRVSVENKGTVDVEEGEYDIELVSVDADGNVTGVLETYSGIRYIAAGASVNQSIQYKFEENGTYTLAARIKVEGETTEEDNISDPITVNVTWIGTDGIFDVMGEGELAYDAATSTLRVNVGEGVLSIVDLAGRRVAEYNLNGVAEIRLELAEGIYVINANGKTLKIRK